MHVLLYHSVPCPKLIVSERAPTRLLPVVPPHGRPQLVTLTITPAPTSDTAKFQDPLALQGRLMARPKWPLPHYRTVRLSKQPTSLC
eukprot:6050462-Amphidinium_carterae.1